MQTASYNLHLHIQTCNNETVADFRPQSPKPRSVPSSCRASSVADVASKVYICMFEELPNAVFSQAAFSIMNAKTTLRLVRLFRCEHRLDRVWKTSDGFKGRALNAGSKMYIGICSVFLRYGHGCVAATDGVWLEVTPHITGGPPRRKPRKNTRCSEPPWSVA